MNNVKVHFELLSWFLLILGNSILPLFSTIYGSSGENYPIIYITHWIKLSLHPNQLLFLALFLNRICQLLQNLGIKIRHSISIYRKQWLPNQVMVILVLSSKLLFQVKTGYWIISNYKNGCAVIEINNTWGKGVLGLL